MKKIILAILLTTSIYAEPKGVIVQIVSYKFEFNTIELDGAGTYKQRYFESKKDGTKFFLHNKAQLRGISGKTISGKMVNGKMEKKESFFYTYRLHCLKENNTYLSCREI